MLGNWASKKSLLWYLHFKYKEETFWSVEDMRTDIQVEGICILGDSHVMLTQSPGPLAKKWKRNLIQHIIKDKGKQGIFKAIYKEKVMPEGTSGKVKYYVCSFSGHTISIAKENSNVIGLKIHNNKCHDDL